MVEAPARGRGAHPRELSIERALQPMRVRVPEVAGVRSGDRLDRAQGLRRGADEATREPARGCADGYCSACESALDTGQPSRSRARSVFGVMPIDLAQSISGLVWPR